MLNVIPPLSTTGRKVGDYEGRTQLSSPRASEPATISFPSSRVLQAQNFYASQAGYYSFITTWVKTLGAIQQTAMYVSGIYQRDNISDNTLFQAIHNNCDNSNLIFFETIRRRFIFMVCCVWWLFGLMYSRVLSLIISYCRYLASEITRRCGEITR